MSIPDKITSFSDSPQVITSAAVSEHQISFASDKERDVFIHSEKMIRIIVAVVGSGLTQGMRVEFRFDTEAGLNSGDHIIAGVSRILLPEVMTTIGDMHLFRVDPIRLPEGYDFAGLWYAVVSTSGAGGFAVYADMVDGPERMQRLDPTL